MGSKWLSKCGSHGFSTSFFLDVTVTSSSWGQSQLATDSSHVFMIQNHSPSGTSISGGTYRHFPQNGF